MTKLVVSAKKRGFADRNACHIIFVRLTLRTNKVVKPDFIKYYTISWNEIVL